jgi:hypothetical protein
MSVFLGNAGNIRLRRGAGINFGVFSDEIAPNDVNTSLGRVGAPKALDNLVTGDRIEVTTSDPRGLVCFAASNWDSNTVENNISGYVNINAVGGLRFFETFDQAVNNDRTQEFTVASFTGDPIPVDISLRDTTLNVLGNVTNYEFNTSRDAIDTTSLNDKFRSQFSAGLISGSGRIDCFFDYKTTGILEPSILLLQTIQRVEIGSNFDLALYLVDSETTPSERSVFYQVEAVVTQAGVTVERDGVVTCSIDFLTTGEIRLLIGEPVGFVLKEDDDRIQLERSLDFLLKETED